MIRLKNRNQAGVKDGRRKKINISSAGVTTTLMTNDKTQPRTITMFFKNSAVIKLCEYRITIQSKNKRLQIKATLARNNSQRIFFGEKYH